jgi:hypothetical protein
MQQSTLKRWLVFLAIWVASASNLCAQGADDYKVYDAVIRHMFRDGITRFDMNAKIGQIVLRDRTHSQYASGSTRENWDQVKIRLRSLTDDTITGYDVARKSEHELNTKLDIPFKYSLISDKQMADVFPNKNEWDKSPEQWNAFYNLYPNSAGYNSFSRVGYDKSGGQALVYFVNWCGQLCGTGSYVLLENGPNGWVVKESAGIWIS